MMPSTTGLFLDNGKSKRDFAKSEKSSDIG
jgi:hypothetical protein